VYGRHKNEGTALQQVATSLLLLLGDRGADHNTNSLVEDILQTLLRERRALKILHRIDFLGFGHTLLEGYRSEVLLTKASNGLGILTKIELGAHEEDGGVGAVVVNLGVPLRRYVLEGAGGNDGEAKKEDVGLRVRQWAKAIIIFLTSSIPKTKIDGLSVYHHIRRVVIENGGNVLAGEGVGGVTNEQASLSDSTVTHNDTLNGLHGVK
jgi:hypothetical protein